MEGSQLALIDPRWPSAWDLFSKIIAEGAEPGTVIVSVLSGEKLDYNAIYTGTDAWKILPAFDHPSSPLSCMLSGTGLTHKASAQNRQKMHEEISNEPELTDSMEIYLWGQAGGKPGAGKIGVQPEWFYKGNGTILKGHDEPLEVPPYGDDGGEEPEIAGVYMISGDGTPFRIGFATANEFSDHVMEKKNYLYLAPSKLRNCAIGPELVLDADFSDVSGEVSVTRGGKVIWAKKIKTGEKNMCHSLENLEHHHFKYEQHRVSGMVHIHFFGADAFTFGEGIRLEDGDRTSVSFEGYGRALVNPIFINPKKEALIEVKPILQ